MKGIAIGSGKLVDRPILMNTADYAFHHGLIDIDHWKKISRYYRNCTLNQLNQNCDFYSLYEEMSDQLMSNKINMFNVYDSTCSIKKYDYPVAWKWFVKFGIFTSKMKLYTYLRAKKLTVPSISYVMRSPQT